MKKISTQKKPRVPQELPKPDRHPEFIPDNEPKDPGHDDPEILPEENPLVTPSPSEVPVPEKDAVTKNEVSRNYISTI